MCTPPPPWPPIPGTPPTLLATGCALSGCAETGVPSPPTDVTAGLTVGFTPPQVEGTDSLPTSSALPRPPMAAPGIPVGRLGGIASATLEALLTAGMMLWARPSTSLNAVVKSLVGEINRINASNPVLASQVCDPVRPSRRSPITPPTTMPSPLEFQTCPASPSAVRKLSRFPIHGGAGISPANAARALVTADWALLEPTAGATADACALSPAGLADSAAVANGASVDAADDAPA